MSKLKANKKESVTPFNTVVKDETWTITDRWLSDEGEVVWYDGFMFKHGVKFLRYFSPEEVTLDKET